jgi:hypothetical protein
VTAATLLEIAAMPEQAMVASLRFLAGQLEAEERKRVLAAQRQRRYRDVHSDVSVASQQRHNNAEVTLARVEDKPLPSLKVDISQKDTPCNPPPEPFDVSRDAKELVEGWNAFWEIYPRRAGGRDKQGAAYLARKYLGTSFPRIGRALGGRDHSTIVYSCERVEKRTHLFEPELSRCIAELDRKSIPRGAVAG